MPHLNKKIDQLYGKKANPTKKVLRSEKENAFLKTARERAHEGATFWKDNWEAALDDLKFLAGEQWPSQIRTERELEERPCLTNNVLPTFVDQVVGDQRQNRPAIKVSPVDMVRVPVEDDESGEEKQESLKISGLSGNKDYELAEVMTGLVKNIEYNSDAETSYDIAFQSALESGFGFLRVRTAYTDGSFNQDVIIDHIKNQFSVVMDPSAKEPDYSDSGWMFINGTMPTTEFKEKYPEALSSPVNQDVASASESNPWFSNNTVTVSEYFIRKAVSRSMALLSDGRAVYLDEIEPVIDELLEKGIGIVRTRKVMSHKVIWYKITGLDILEGPIDVPSSTIPVVPVFGKSITIKNDTIYRSLIRHSKDAQRMANYWDSAATESVALAPKAPFVGAEGHFEGYEDEWKQANTKNFASLTFVPQFQGDTGPRREQPSAVPAAEITMSASSGEKIKSTLGMYDASLGQAGNETSGRAIAARQRQGDKGSFAFIDNLSKAIARIGKITIETALKVIDTEQIVRIKFQDETEDYVKLNEQVLDDETNKWVTISDLNVMKYDVVVTTGPSYSTQRMEAADAMIQFAQAVPNAAGAIGDLIALNMDWPGADTIAERLKKMVPAELLSKEEQEKIAEDAPEQEGPTPEQQVQLAELEARGAEAQADMAKSEATQATAQADIVTAQLESAEAQAKLQIIEAGAATGDPAYQFVKEMVAQAIVDIQGQKRA